MKRIIFFAAVGLGLWAGHAHAQVFQGSTPGGTLTRSNYVNQGGGGGGPSTVIIASDTFARIPSTGSNVAFSTTTGDNTKRWRPIYGTAQNIFVIRGANWNGLAVVGGSVSVTSSADDQAVFIETSAVPTSGYKVVAGFVAQSSANVCPGVMFQANSGASLDHYFWQKRDGSIMLYRSNSGSETELAGIPYALSTSTPTFIGVKVDIDPGNSVTISLDLHNDGSYELVYVDTDANRIEAIGVIGLRNYYADNATTRVIKQIWVEQAPS